jgi:hypothetical protein
MEITANQYNKKMAVSGGHSRSVFGNGTLYRYGVNCWEKKGIIWKAF